MTAPEPRCRECGLYRSSHTTDGPIRVLGSGLYAKSILYCAGFVAPKSTT